MSKKKFLTIVGCLIVLAGLLAGGVFLYRTRNIDSGSENSAAAEKIRKWIPGEWIIAAEGAIEAENAELHFSDTACTRLENGQAVFERTYSINDLSHLILNDPQTDYIVEKVTDRFAKLVDSQTAVSIAMIKKEGLTAATEADIQGSWQVAVHGGTFTESEELSFENGSFTLTRDGQQAVQNSYTFHEPSTIEIPDLNFVMSVYSLDGNTLFLIEKGTGYVWELQKEQ